MKEKTFSFFKQIWDNFKFKIFLFMLLPSLIAIFFSYFSLLTFKNEYKETLKSSYMSLLENFSTVSEQSFESISYSINVLSENERFINTANGIFQSSDDILYAQNILKNIKFNHNIVDSISIIDRKNESVYTQNARYTISDYFSKVYKYDNYDTDYWDSYIAAMSAKYVLPPSAVHTEDSQKSIIPIVFSKIGNKRLSNLIIVNINLSDVMSILDGHTIFNGSTLSMFNKTTHQDFHDDTISTITDKKLIDLLYDSQKSSFDYTLYGKKSFIVAYSPTYSSLGYIYTITTPHDIIESKIPGIFNILIAVCAIMFVISLCIITFGTKEVYSPFKKISDLFPDNTENNINTLHTLIADTLETNKTMEEQLNFSLPYLKEQQLIHILNSTEHYNAADNPSFSFDFTYDYFCSVIVKIMPTDNFHEKYDNITEKTIELSLYSLIKSEFYAHFEHIYIFPSDEHTLYILLNVEGPESKSHIDVLRENLTKTFSYDSDDLNFSMSAGTIREGIEGLKTSHQEALEDASKSQLLKQIRIQINNPHPKREIVDFTHSEETALYNRLIVSNTDEASASIKQKFESVYESNPSKAELSQLYTSIFNVIFKVMRIKNINYNAGTESDSELINSIISLKTTEIEETLFGYIESLKKQNDSKKIDSAAVISYIQENYNKNIYLESIAEQFNTSASYLSRLIKKETSVSFSEYLNILRIEKAKELLLNSKLSIKDIYEQLGFNNRNTFIRAFKALVSVTPSEYRNNSNQ